MKTSSANILPNSLSSFGSMGSLPSGGGSTAALECPKCSKHTVVRRSPNHYDCLNCNFHKSLPPVTRLPAEPGQPVRMGSSGSLHRLQQQASRAVIEQHRYSPYEAEFDKTQPLLFAAIAVIFGILFL